MRCFFQTTTKVIFSLQVSALLFLTPAIALAEVASTDVPAVKVVTPIQAAASETDVVCKLPAVCGQPVVCSPPDSWFAYGVPITVLFVALVVIAGIKRVLANTKWSLADALSEEVQITAWDTSVTPNRPLLDAAGNPLMVTEMRASSSRVIALMGMLVILLMFIGFGAFALFTFGKTCTFPSSLDDAMKFLVSGMTLFAPYLVNKFSNLFGGTVPRQ